MTYLLKTKWHSSQAAGSGLALQTAKAFAESGAAVVLADWMRSPRGLQPTKLVAQGHKALASSANVSDDGQVEQWLPKLLPTFGRSPCGLTNNAGSKMSSQRLLDSYPRRLRPGDGGQSARCMELHEV